jgi:hypothetical protein
MGHTEIARSLLRGGADPSLRNETGADARVKAEQYGHADMVALLDEASRDGESSDPAVTRAETPTPRESSVETPGGASQAASQLSESQSETPREARTDGEAKRAAAPPAAEARETPPATRRPARRVPVEAHFWVLRDAVVRAGASQDSERIDALTAGTRVFVRDRVRNWYEVEYDDREGYIYVDLLERAEELESSPAPRNEPELGEPRSPLVLASGRWATPDNPAMCTRDFLDVSFLDERLTLVVYAAGERTVLAEDLPVVEMADGRIEAGQSGLVWRLAVTPDELRYQFGFGKEVRYVRCPNSPELR